MLISELKDKSILIWGFGVEGSSAFNVMKNITDKIVVAVKDKSKCESMCDGVKFINEDEILNSEYDYVIKSSGVSKYRKDIETLEKRGTKITTIQNIFLSEVSDKKNKNNLPKIIGITGTKGKSTTASMINHILNNLGFKSILVGNIGVSVFDVLSKMKEYDYVVIEFSSYQCAMLEEKLDYSVVLNLFPEHIDWHLTHENYFRDKLNITKFSDSAVISYNNDTVKRYLDKNLNNVTYFNNKDGFHINGDFICFCDEKIYNINDIATINGIHIFENLCSILTILKNEGLDVQKAMETLKTFKTLEHRLEVFYKSNNMICVDDSISTIPEATIRAINTFKNDIYLVLGGYDRQQDFNELINTINAKGNIKKLFLTGETGKRMLKLFSDTNLKIEYDYYDSLREIVSSIDFNKLNDTTLLLSPASASYDKYKNFEERGNLFKSLINDKIKRIS